MSTTTRDDYCPMCGELLDYVDDTPVCEFCGYQEVDSYLKNAMRRFEDGFELISLCGDDSAPQALDVI